MFLSSVALVILGGKKFPNGGKNRGNVISGLSSPNSGLLYYERAGGVLLAEDYLTPPNSPEQSLAPINLPQCVLLLLLCRNYCLIDALLSVWCITLWP